MLSNHSTILYRPIKLTLYYSVSHYKLDYTMSLEINKFLHISVFHNNDILSISGNITHIYK